MGAGCLEHALRLPSRKRNRFAKRIHAFRKTVTRDSRDHAAADEFDIGLGILRKLRRNGMCPEKGGRHAYLELPGNTRCDPQDLDFGIKAQAVTRFDFDGRNALGHHGIYASRRKREKSLLACLSRLLYGGPYSTARARNFLIGRAFAPHFPFVRAVSRENDM